MVPSRIVNRLVLCFFRINRQLDFNRYAFVAQYFLKNLRQRCKMWDNATGRSARRCLAEIAEHSIPSLKPVLVLVQPQFLQAFLNVQSQTFY